MTKPPPIRALGFWMCTALVVGNMIGTGVFLLPASLAPYGWSALPGWTLTIAGGLCLAWVLSRLSAAMPREGGPYAFTRAAFGPAPAFMVAWSYWVCLWVGNAAIAVGSVSYLSVFFPALETTHGLHAAVTIAVVWLFTAINCVGVQTMGRVQVAATILKLIPLAGVVLLAIAVLLGWSRGESARLTPFDPSQISFAGVTASATLTLWALLGLESATIPAEKVADAERIIPRATMTGVVITGVVYLLVCSATVLLMPADEMAASSAPFSDFVVRYLDPRAGAAVAAFAAISGFGALNGWILLQGELPYAMAKDGVFPRWFAKANTSGTPVRSHLFVSGLLTLVILLNYSKTMTEAFTFLILVSTTSALVMYLAVSLAALALQRRGAISGAAGFAAIASAAAVYSVWAIAGAGGKAVFWGFALLATGAPVYLLINRARRTAPAE
jgi:APA family basic amino acid/polyamine antiporter